MKSDVIENLKSQVIKDLRFQVSEIGHLMELLDDGRYLSSLMSAVEIERLGNIVMKDVAELVHFTNLLLK